MNFDLQVKENGKTIYPIILTSSYDRLEEVFHSLDTFDKKLCVVTDHNVDRIYKDELLNKIKEYGKEVYWYSFSPGEKHKNLETVYALYEKLIKWKFDRKDMLLALGGGVVGDLTGYVAATYLRGISFIQLPTSLLAMVDSSVGGKTGVDFKGYKNMVGAFYQPRAVYINLKTLDTLEKNHYYNGMAEIIKHGLIKDIEYFNWLRKKEEQILQYDKDTLSYMIWKSCHIKKEVVEKDPKELKERALLNFGHTIGHAIEKYMDFQLLHGECVSIGMVASSLISYKRGYLTKEEFDLILQVLKTFNLPVSIKELVNKTGFSVNDLLDIIALDKKQESGKLKFILLKELGKGIIKTNVKEEEIRQAFDYILN